MASTETLSVATAPSSSISLSLLSSCCTNACLLAPCSSASCLLFLWGTALLALIVMQLVVGNDVWSMWIMMFGTSSIYGTVLIRHYWCRKSWNENQHHELLPMSEEQVADNTATTSLEDDADLASTFLNHGLVDPRVPLEEEQESLSSSAVLQKSVESSTVTTNDDSPSPACRLHYLDNLKTALTFVVVTHHTFCAFGACGKGWVLVVGLYSSKFGTVAQMMTILNQGYFMSLFFLVSGYVTPSSLQRKGGTDAFLVNKAKRLWIPLLFLTFIFFPSLTLYCAWIAKSRMGYFAYPGHGWFLLWLLALDLVYCTSTTVQNKNDNDVDAHNEENNDNNEDNIVPFPSFCHRWLYGFTICGVIMFFLIVMFFPHGFGAMPISIGSLSNDLFLFGVGLKAHKHGWLDATRTKPLRQHMDISPFCLKMIVVLEAVVMCVTILMAMQQTLFSTKFFLLGGMGVCVSGLYCLDMSLVLLEFFQTKFNFTNQFLKKLSKAAYTVYLIHPLLIAVFTGVFVYIYQSVFQLGILEFDGVCSSTPLKGGSWTLFVGWLGVFMATHLMVWPVAWYLQKLPLLRDIL